MPVTDIARPLARAMTRHIGEFSHHLLVADLPSLPADRRAATVTFITGRTEHLPSPMKLGVGLVAVVLGGLGRAMGTGRVVRIVADRPLPVVGDYVRLVRSLGYAYIWETWPVTAADGAPR